MVRRNPSWRRGEGREIGPVLAYCVFDNSELKRDIFGEWNSRGTTGGFHSRIRGGLLARRSTVAKALRRAYLTRHLPTVDSIYTPLRVFLAFQPAGCVRAAARWPPCGAFLIAWYRDIREIRAGRDHYDRFRLVNGVSPAISGIAGNLLLPRLIRIGRGNKGDWPLKRRIKNYQSQYSRFLSPFPQIPRNEIGVSIITERDISSIHVDPTLNILKLTLPRKRTFGHRREKENRQHLRTGSRPTSLILI